MIPYSFVKKREVSPLEESIGFLLLLGFAVVLLIYRFEEKK